MRTLPSIGISMHIAYVYPNKRTTYKAKNVLQDF